MYARMVIGETISEDQVREFSLIYASDVLPDLAREPGFESGRFLVEDGGNMAVALTIWKSREDCLRYHSSRVLSTIRDENTASAGGKLCREIVQGRCIAIGEPGKAPVFQGRPGSTWLCTTEVLCPFQAPSLPAQHGRMLRVLNSGM